MPSGSDAARIGPSGSCIRLPIGGRLSGSGDEIGAGIGVDVQLVMGIGVPAVGLIVWLVRLEGRINGHDIQHKQAAERHDEMRQDISYIRNRIDAALHQPTAQAGQQSAAGRMN